MRTKCKVVGCGKSTLYDEVLERYGCYCLEHLRLSELPIKKGDEDES